MENTYIVSDELFQNMVVIDPGSEAEKIMEQIDRGRGIWHRRVVPVCGGSDDDGSSGVSFICNGWKNPG